MQLEAEREADQRRLEGVVRLRLPSVGHLDGLARAHDAVELGEARRRGLHVALAVEQ